MQCAECRGHPSLHLFSVVCKIQTSVLVRDVAFSAICKETINSKYQFDCGNVYLELCYLFMF